MSGRVQVFLVTELNVHLAQELEKLELEELWACLLIHANQMTQQTSDSVHEPQLCLVLCTDFLSIRKHGCFFMAASQFLGKVLIWNYTHKGVLGSVVQFR